MASTDLRLTGQTPTNNKIFTFSAWVKRGTLGAQAIMYWENNSNSSQNFRIATRSDDVLQILDYSGAVVMDYRTTQVFRDTSAFYNIVVAVDTTNATANDRTKLWVNGERVSSFGTQTTYSLNDSTQAQQSNYFCSIGSLTSQYWDGSMAHVHFIDGTAYDADTFGETDATTGIWKPKTAPSVTYGTNGFFLKFENSGAFGTDSSGNGNNFTVNGTMTQTIDTPSNVFATLNPLMRSRLGNDGVYSSGNTKLTMTADNANRGYGFTTFGVTQGKWYWEVKVLTPERAMVGVGDAQFVSAQTVPFYDVNPSYAVALNCTQGALNYNNTSSTSYHGSAVSANDIIQVALDMDNHLLWYGINGTWLNSATQTEIENGTSTNDVTTAIGTQNVINNGEAIFPFVADPSTSGKSNFECNFGNGIFGTTAVSSAQNPDDGVGIFEFSPPTGYKSLCTKSINSQEYD